MKQLNLFEDEDINEVQTDIEKIKELGYKVEKAFNVNFGNRLDDTYKVIRNDVLIAFIQDNENGTFNVIGGLSIRYNLNIDESVERINFINKYRKEF